MARKLTILTERDGKLSPLTNCQELFCRYYTTPGETWMNGYRSYAAAFGIEIPDKPKKLMNKKEFAIADHVGTSASLLLRNLKVKNRINELIDEQISDKTADRELQKVVLQDKELSPKIQAIKAYNELNKRVSSQTTILHLDLTKLFEESIKRNAEEENKVLEEQNKDIKNET